MKTRAERMPGDVALQDRAVVAVIGSRSNTLSSKSINTGWPSITGKPAAE